MRHETDILKAIDEIVMGAKAIAILQRPDLTLLQAQRMIETMRAEYLAKFQEPRELDEGHECEVRSDLQDLIDDDNRDRANDMNKAGGY